MRITSITSNYYHRVNFKTREPDPLKFTPDKNILVPSPPPGLVLTSATTIPFSPPGDAKNFVTTEKTPESGPADTATSSLTSPSDNNIEIHEIPATNEISEPGPVDNNYEINLLPDTDRNEVIIRIKAKAEEDQAELLIQNPAATNSSCDSDTFREVLSKKPDGWFEFSIDALNAQNQYLSNIKVVGFATSDRNACPIKSMSENNLPEKLKKIDAAELFKSTRVGKLTLNNSEDFAHFEIMSEGTAEGKVFFIREHKELQGTERSDKEEEEYKREFKNYAGTEPRIVYLELTRPFMRDMMENEAFIVPPNIKGFIFPSNVNNPMASLGHVAARLRSGGQVGVEIDMDEKSPCKFVSKVLTDAREHGNYVRIEAEHKNLKIQEIPHLTPDKRQRAAHANLETNLSVQKPLNINSRDFRLASVGLKAFNVKKLFEASQKPNSGYSVPPFFVIPAGLLHAILECNYGSAKDKPPEYESNSNNNTYRSIVVEIERREKHGEDVEPLLKELRTLIKHPTRITIPDNIERKIITEFESQFKVILPYTDHRKNADTKLYKKTGPKMYKAKENIPAFIARSSFTGEDSDTFPTQGLYNSIAPIRTKTELLNDGLRGVWASKWSDMAYKTRHNYGVSHRLIHPNIIVQQMVPVDYMFTIYTDNPRNKGQNEMLIELSKGTDSCMMGQPYKFTYDRKTEDIVGSIIPSRSMRVNMTTKYRMKDLSMMFLDDPVKAINEPSNYREPYEVFHKGQSAYNDVIEKIAKVAKSIEEDVGAGIPQDIEGGIKFVKKTDSKGQVTYEPEIHIWQTRNIFSPDSQNKSGKHKPKDKAVEF